MDPAYYVFAGENVEKKVWEEICSRCGKGGAGEFLVAVQEDLHGRGFRAAVLVRSTRGWYVRYASSLDDCGIIVPSRDIPQGEDGGFFGAVRAAQDWVDGDPEHRYAYTTKKAWKTSGQKEW